jgi:hypothetical protein
MDECLIFQKLSSQEMIILSALDHLDKTKEVSSESEEDSENDESETDEENNNL